MQKNGRMASVETQELFEKLQDRLKMLSLELNSDSSNNIVVWLPISRQKDLWLDDYTNRTIPSVWNKI